MKKRRTLIIVLVIGLCFAFVLAYQYQAGGNLQKKDPPRIAVVLYESGTDRWASVSLGLRQACAEVGIEMTNVILADIASADQQQALIEREISAGAEGLIVAANNSNEMTAYLQEVATRLPLVLVETGAGDTLNLVAPDNAAMGRSLANGKIAAEESVAIIAHNLQRESVRRRYSAFIEEARKNGTALTVWQPGSQDLSDYLAIQMGAWPRQTVVAFDTETLECAVDTAVALDIQPRLFGIGSNEKIVYYLDRQLVQEICYANEFNMGYIALMQLARHMGINTPQVPDTIDAGLARHDNLYEPAVERVLFPIIQ